MSWNDLSTVERVVAVVFLSLGLLSLMRGLSDGWTGFGTTITVVLLAIPVAILLKDGSPRSPPVMIVDRPGPAPPPQVIFVQAPAPVAPAPPVQAIAAHKAPAGAVQVPEKAGAPYDVTKAGEYLDCCANCIDRPMCYATQGELNKKWDTKCDDYQRDAMLNKGRVVDVSKLKDPAKKTKGGPS